MKCNPYLPDCDRKKVEDLKPRKRIGGSEAGVIVDVLMLGIMHL